MHPGKKREWHWHGRVKHDKVFSVIGPNPVHLTHGSNSTEITRPICMSKVSKIVPVNWNWARERD